MARTTITDHVALLGPASARGNIGQAVHDLQQAYASAQADADVATDPEDGAFYAGQVEGLHLGLNALTDCDCFEKQA